jgi:hypothetical protein
MSQQPLPYEVIPDVENPLLTHFGGACLPLEQMIYSMIGRMAGDHYTGGMWEFRKFANGALAMAFPDATIIEPITENQSYVKASLEAVSIAAWMITLRRVMEHAAGAGNRQLVQLLNDHFFGLKDALGGYIEFVITPGVGQGCREVTAAEKRQLKADGKLQKHAEYSAILSIID